MVDVEYDLKAEEYLDKYLADFSVTEDMSEIEANTRAGIFDQRQFWQTATSYKNPAFSEEKEVRLLHEPTLSPKDGDLIRADALSPVDFQVKHDRLIPFVTFSLTDSERQPYREIVLGPKNHFRENALSIRMLLEAHGVSFGAHQIRLSNASYR